MSIFETIKDVAKATAKVVGVIIAGITGVSAIGAITGATTSAIGKGILEAAKYKFFCSTSQIVSAGALGGAIMFPTVGIWGAFLSLCCCNNDSNDDIAFNMLISGALAFILTGMMGESYTCPSDNALFRGLTSTVFENDTALSMFTGGGVLVGLLCVGSCFCIYLQSKKTNSYAILTNDTNFKNEDKHTDDEEALISCASPSPSTSEEGKVASYGAVVN